MEKDCNKHINETILQKEFYSRNPKKVAYELLGKKIIRRFDNNILSGIIVETEAYYGDKDPASRAFKGRKTYNSMMWDEPGRLFIYNVHKYWMLNLVAHEVNSVGGVLIRSLEPLWGIEYMKMQRKVKNIYELTNGPGKLSVSFKITKELNGCFTTSQDGPLIIINKVLVQNYDKSKRIGIKKDLSDELRFFIKNNKFVSK
ncbi:DNA-3-methyladenine glycosylase [Candidatus Bathyarchaeota archaeon]|nr:DNA-3-methyladenine glycosylase [Candidatus Bathyarchaeota archaeon]